MVLSGDCGVAAGPAEPQVSQCSPSWERLGTGMGGHSYSPALGRGRGAVQALEMLWKEGAAAEGTPRLPSHRAEPRPCAGCAAPTDLREFRDPGDPRSRGLAGGGQ